MKRISLTTILFVIFMPTVTVATDVGGIINTDTTWDLAGSPYNLTSIVQVAEGVTLTIEPGVIINRGETVNVIEFWGSLLAVGNHSARIFFNGITLLGISSTRIDFAEFGGAGAQIYGSDLTLKESIFRDGTQVYCGDCYVEQNIFYDALLSVQGSGLDVIRNNVFYAEVRNPLAMGIPAFCSNPTIEYNSFLKTDSTAIELSPGDVECTVTATNNYWNTTDTSIIDSMIYDRNDNLHISGDVVYTPFLAAPHPDTPPNTSFKASITAGRPPITVNFTDQSILGITSWEWDFGDGSTSTKQNPSHIYTDYGNYTVSLTVSDILGMQDTYTDTITLTRAMPGMPLLLLDD